MAHLEDCSLGLLHSFGFALLLVASTQEYMLMITGQNSGWCYIVLEIIRIFIYEIPFSVCSEKFATAIFLIRR